MIDTILIVFRKFLTFYWKKKQFLVVSRNSLEVGQSCRGSINLQEARIHTDKATNNLTISAPSQTFHLKAQNELDHEQWFRALEYARHRAVRAADSGFFSCPLWPRSCVPPGIRGIEFLSSRVHSNQVFFSSTRSRSFYYSINLLLFSFLTVLKLYSSFAPHIIYCNSSFSYSTIFLFSLIKSLKKQVVTVFSDESW